MVKTLSRSRFFPVWLIILLFLVISIVTRIVLLVSIPASGITFPQAAGAFCIGLLYDSTVAVFVILPFVLQLWLQNNVVYRKRLLPFITAFFIGLIALLLFTNVVPRAFCPPLHTALIVYVVLRFAVYLLLFFMPAFRQRWRAGVLYTGLGLVIFLLLLNAVSEWFFWQEFSTRYNFIAVDYLVYTTEVLGNIGESYPIGWILAALLIIAALTVYLFRKPVRQSVQQPLPVVRRSLLAIVLMTLPLLVYHTVSAKWRQFSRNEYANSLAGDGLFEFATAFTQNELDFYQFYTTLPDTMAFRITREQLQMPNSRFISNDPYSIEREISYAEPERKQNVVLISVESLSADFMRAFGNTENITPQLDSLAAHSLFFNNLYASGTRTVRGLEALSLSIPPTPGQSIVKRPDNGGLFSLGSVLRSHGYTTQYLYGGYSYFDNMKTFFGNNGYTVIDRSAIPPGKVHYENIWGVADEDLFSLTLQVLDSNNATGKPFFTHIMTVSNHRPYTYPEGRIDIPPARQVRQGAVKYTDYAIGRFLREARSKKWFDSTIFVIVSDHCAGSAGSVELPVTGYHIPMLIYAPALLQPREVNTLAAQIDVAPTILGLLNLRYRSKFFGQDLLHLPPGRERAFISTYQGLGYLRNGRLVVQSPVQRLSHYTPDFATGNATPAPPDDTLTRQAIAYYQSISWLLKHRRQQE